MGSSAVSAENDQETV